MAIASVMADPFTIKRRRQIRSAVTAVKTKTVASDEASPDVFDANDLSSIAGVRMASGKITSSLPDFRRPRAKTRK
jgi:hypothetical protein